MSYRSKYWEPPISCQRRQSLDKNYYECFPLELSDQEYVFKLFKLIAQYLFDVFKKGGGCRDVEFQLDSRREDSPIFKTALSFIIKMFLSNLDVQEIEESMNVFMVKSNNIDSLKRSSEVLLKTYNEFIVIKKSNQNTREESNLMEECFSEAQKFINLIPNASSCQSLKDASVHSIQGLYQQVMTIVLFINSFIDKITIHYTC